MDKLIHMIEAILFAAGNGVPISEIADKLELTTGEVKKALGALKDKFGEDGGIRLLQFNGKAQLATNPTYKAQVEAVLNPIREKELTNTVLECVAIIAYKQPITKTEIELIRGVNSDYPVHVLLELKLIYPYGRKDAVGRPILYATTDEFLKRFKLNSLQDLPDYDELMAAITEQRGGEESDSYLYAKEEYSEEAQGTEGAEAPKKPAKKQKEKKPETESDEEPQESIHSGYEIPDFLRGLDEADILKIG